MRTLILIMTFIAALSLSVFAQNDTIEELLIGSEAPGFSLPDLNNEYVFLRDYCGEKLRKPYAKKEKQVVVISFFATWCVPCKKEIPHLMKLEERFKNKPVKFFLIDVGETKDKVEPFLTENNITLPVLIDQYQVTSKKYGATSLPRLTVIDKQGKVQKYKKGFEEAEPFEAEMEALLNELISR